MTRRDSMNREARQDRMQNEIPDAGDIIRLYVGPGKAMNRTVTAPSWSSPMEK